MPTDEQKLCDVCHERLATCHNTIFVGATMTRQDLCTICWEQLTPADQLAVHLWHQEIICNGKCKYCGDPAAMGSFTGGLVTTPDQVTLSCEECSMHLAEFMSRPENILPDDFPEEDAAGEQCAQRLTAIAAAADEYVRRKAQERKAGK